MAVTKFFRVALEGPTVDGREITREQIQQMADTYNPATFTARINCEHLRGYSPEGPFNAWGSVVALKAEQGDVEIAGKTEKRLGLYAQFDVTEQAKAYNKAGQKLFSSVEIHPNFSNSNKAYLVGTAVTDSPASLGTEVLKFSRDDARKDNMSQIGEFVLEFEDAAPASDAAAGAFAAVTNFFNRFNKAPEPVTPPAPPVQQPGNDTFDFAKFSAGLAEQFAGLNTGITSSLNALESRMAAQGKEMETLKASVEGQTSPRHNPRPLGGGGDKFTRAEC